MKKSNNLGWQCPICKTVYSPYIKECTKCTPVVCKFVITKNQIYDDIVKMLTKDLDIPIRKIKTTASFYDDLGLDSLDCVEGVIKLEQYFGIAIDDEEAEKCFTVWEIVELVYSKLN
jgi:acyl carrier protein